jgi:L-ribulose-5-phosphate 3-epimerase
VRYLMFSKHLQELDVPAAGQAIKGLGFDSVELTIRPSGHVLPERATEDLPGAVEALAAIGLTVPALVTDIKGKDAPYARKVCAAAAEVGATCLRNGAWPYRPFGTIREQVAAATRNARELEELGRDYGLRFCVHCHSGGTLTAHGALLAQIIADTDPRYVSASFDLGHLTVEGGNGGWVQSIDLLQDRIGILAVKSFGWFSASDPGTGGTHWTPKLVPLTAGAVQWARAFTLLRQVGWDSYGQALVSLHSEYQNPRQGATGIDPALASEHRDRSGRTPNNGTSGRSTSERCHIRQEP